MSFKRIISTALTVVMIFTTLIAAFPLGASAAYVNSGSQSASVPEGTTEANLTDAERTAYLQEYISYNFTTAEDMLEHELNAGYLYASSSTDGVYTLYVNKYTGFVFYVNNFSGQILTSNPINPAYGTVSEANRKKLMSQILLGYSLVSDSAASPLVLNSYDEAVKRNQISVSPIAGGFRVDYTLGDTTVRYLLPGCITATRFDEAILKPLLLAYQAMLEKYCSEEFPNENFSFFENSAYTPINEYGFIETTVGSGKKGVSEYLKATKSIYDQISDDSNKSELASIKGDIEKILQYYKLHNPLNSRIDESTLNKMNIDYPITKKGIAIYALNLTSENETDNNDAKSNGARIIKEYIQDYTFNDVYADEAECGYNDPVTSKPVFKCSLEYTLNKDGSLSVNLPVKSIIFDDSTYVLKYITPLMYFGAGSMTEEGYVFYPDGSGTVVDFKDFYDPEVGKYINLTATSDLYGIDYAYSEIDAGAYREQITMPVFGVVNEVNANESSIKLGAGNTVTNGYVAVIEEGSALASLCYELGGSNHKFANAYATYTPNAYDSIDLTETISVSNAKSYVIVSESKYTGSIKTRYSMLSDSAFAGILAFNGATYYESSYVGMASYYRSYLEGTDVIKALELVNGNLPLYIEVLGAMDILDKFLTFPITKSIALTKFSDIKEIYNQLSDCTNYVNGLVAKYEGLLATETDDVERINLQNELERYKALQGQITDMKNINFRLTGFANGGMISTYPAKVKWQKSCGGKSGFKSLVSEAAKISQTAGYNFGIYPEFDFMYISATAAFDGISNRNTAVKMVDNRYATKQIYDIIDQEFEKPESKIMLVSADVLNKFYSKFFKKYSKFNVEGLSVSTLGSTLNSNFDEKDPVNREEAKDYVSALLDRMTDESQKKSYDLMIDTGNIYAVKYASHILNISTDSSHLSYSSYTVPFVGLVLHSYVNYASTPINYSGNADYDLLRSIENGSALYYIVAYRNTAYMKESEKLNEYYGVDYHNWFDSIVTTYNELNLAIGDLQNHKIVDHEFILAERVIESIENAENQKKLQNEILDILKKEINIAIDAKYEELYAGGSENYGKKIKLVINTTSLINQFADILNMDVAVLYTGDFKVKLDEIVTKYHAEYAGDAAFAENTVEVVIEKINYKSNYSYITDSFAEDEDYVRTKYTVDKGSVAMVTYMKGTSAVTFILNYNTFPITVKTDENHTYQLGAYEYVRIG